MQTKKGFTLIELLVVVLIIGILAAVALPQYRVAVEKARMSEAMVVLRSIKEAEVRYRLANGVYTTQIDELDISLPSTTTYDTWVKLPSGILVSIAGITADDPYIHATNKASTNTLLFRFNGLRKCHAKQNNKVANQVCKSLGGKNPTDDDGCSIGSCTKYDL